MLLLSLHTSLLITGLLLLGATVTTGINNLFLYIQYKERIIRSYCLYLLAITAYISCYLLASYYSPELYHPVYYVKESMNVLTILTYTYFMYEAVSEWQVKYVVFFRMLRLAMQAALFYCFFVLIAALFKWQAPIITIYLPIAVRLIFMVFAILSVKFFFTRMKGPFLTLVKWGAVTYLFFALVIMATLLTPDESVLGLDQMHITFLATFIEIVIFSMAMAYKVKMVMARTMEIRNRISQDLHDDVGASLSSLQIYGSIAEQTMVKQPAKAAEMLQKIHTQTKEIMENMNDIVWSMKGDKLSNVSIEVRIKNYAASLLSDSNINFTYSIMPGADDLVTGMTARKNILLIAKEAMNNIVKYSKAANASLTLQRRNDELVLIMKDDGTGFNIKEKMQGNGLGNMRQRTNELGGNLEITSSQGLGTTIRAVFPVAHIH